MSFLDFPVRYSSLSSDQTSAISDGGLVKEIGNAFTATYLLRRLNSK